MVDVLRKVLAACLSALLLSVVLATMAVLPGSLFGRGWLDYFVFYLVLASPVMLVGGVPISMAAGWLVGRVRGGPGRQYAAELLVYVLGGLLVMGVLTVLLLRHFVTIRADGTLLGILGVGAAGSLLFLHVELLLRRFVVEVKEKADGEGMDT